MKKMNQIALLLMMTVIVACKKDDVTPETPQPTNDEELITSVKLTFIDENSVQDTVYTNFVDLDGPGGNAPSSFDTIRLVANTNYLVKIEFLDETKNPSVNITEEVLEEASEHIICYDPSNLNVTINRTDSDGTYELGLTSRWLVGASSTGNTIIRLKHQPGVKNGSCDPGETDVELNFQTIIQ